MRSEMCVHNSRYDRKQQGFGGQSKPILRKKAKTTKKLVLRIECSTCKWKHQVNWHRRGFPLVGGSNCIKPDINRSFIELDGAVAVVLDLIEAALYWTWLRGGVEAGVLNLIGGQYSNYIEPDEGSYFVEPDKGSN
jgi:hypothetical protein